MISPAARMTTPTFDPPAYIPLEDMRKESRGLSEMEMNKALRGRRRTDLQSQDGDKIERLFNVV